MPRSTTAKGPEITWNIDDVRQAVRDLGEAMAVDLIAGDVFQREYVAKRIRELLIHGTDDGKLVKDLIILGSEEI